MDILKRRTAFLIDVLLVLSVILIIAVLITGGWVLHSGKMKIPLNSINYPVRVFALLVFIRILLTDKNSAAEGYIGKLMQILPQGRKSGNADRLFSGITVFLTGGMILAVFDALLDGLKHHRTIFTPLFPSYMCRLDKIWELLLYYGFGSFMAGLAASAVVLFITAGIKGWENKNILLLLSGASFALTTGILTNSRGAFNIISNEPYGPLPAIDIAVVVVSAFGLLRFLPFYLINKQGGMSSLSVFAFAIAISFYPFLDYLEKRMADEESAKPHKRVILITIDTARADHFSSYGYPKETTPYIDKLSREGVLFKNAYSQMPTTDPSHTTILSGTYPRTHGILKNGMTLSNKKINFLQQWFSKSGFTTAAITSRALLDPDEMGIPPFDYKSVPSHKFITGKGSKFKSDIATGIYKRAVKWIDRNYHKDFFLWVHFWDPHGKYYPPAPYNSKFNSGYKGKYRTPKRELPGFTRDESGQYSDEEIEYITSLYDGEIAFADKYIAKLIDYINKKLPEGAQKPLYIITSDHGETLGEIQYKSGYSFDHGEFLTYSQLHVPLLFIWDGMLQGGTVIENPVGLVDIAPTIAELINAKEGFICDGNSFKSIIDGNSELPESRKFIISERRKLTTEVPEKYNFLLADEFAVITGQYLLRINDVMGTELFDIIADPLEKNNLYPGNDEITQELLGKIEEWKKKFPETKVETKKTSREKAKVLKSLGYIQ